MFFVAQHLTVLPKMYPNRAPNQDQNSLVPLKYTVAIYTGMPPKFSGYNTA